MLKMRKLTKAFIGAFIISVIAYIKPAMAKINILDDRPTNINEHGFRQFMQSFMNYILIYPCIIAILLMIYAVSIIIKAKRLEDKTQKKKQIKKGKIILIFSMTTIIAMYLCLELIIYLQ